MTTPKLFAWECNVRGKDWARVINHLAAGKARYEYLRDLQDSWPDATFADITVRKAGEPQTSAQLARVMSYRCRPELTAGTRVQVCGARLGWIVDGNDSANFDVLLDIGGVVNCHPLDLCRTFSMEGAAA